MKDLKQLMISSETRYINYSKQLEDLFKQKLLYNVDDFNSYRLLLKENRNIEEIHMKHLSIEREFESGGGLNPPYMYNY